MTASYAAFLAAKAQLDGSSGFEPSWMPDRLFPFQVFLTEWALRQGRAALFEDCGLGKAQPLDEPVLTPTGWQPMEKLRVGSEVIGGDGQPTKVVAVHPQGVRPIRLIRFSDGTSVRCDESHLWAVRSDNQHKRGQPWKILSTAELSAGALRYDRKDDWGTYAWRIPLCRPARFASGAPLPVDPYVLGVLLGDGCLTQPKVIFTSQDAEIAERVRVRLPAGIRLVPLSPRNHCPQYRISAVKGQHSPFVAALRSLGLMGLYAWQKHIPAQYMTASPDDRLELLRGLLDTDGEAAKSHVQFCTTSPQLAEAVTEIVQSLGGTARTKTKCPRYTYNGESRRGRIAYLVQVRLPRDLEPFTIRRKTARYSARRRLDPVRKIIAIEDAGTAECMCITVDNPSPLYVTKGYAVTHNSPQELTWAQNVYKHTGKPVLLLAPLGVTFQMQAEAEKFGIEAVISRDGSAPAGVTVTNYERLEKFSPARFGGVVCDESSILKAFDGTRRKMITEFARGLPYRLLGTATAAPNDYVELGTSSEALGYLGYMDMLAAFFTNKEKTMKSMGGRWRPHSGEAWRFKGHAEDPFWRWVSSWARTARKPSDLGFDDNGFILPPLQERLHIVKARTLAVGTLFDLPAHGLQEEREEARRTLPERCEKAAELLADADHGVAWCHLNDEGKLLARLISGAVEVAGSDSNEDKEEKLAAFARGEIRVLVTKPKIASFGLNWQHCHRMTFFPSHSYEQMFQAVRRCWRFGQTRPVTVDMVATEGGANVLRNLERKAAAADRMFDSLTAHVNDALAIRRTQTFSQEAEVPSWITS